MTTKIHQPLDGPGVPYANVEEDEQGRWYEECPVCGEKFYCRQGKDFESLTSDYADHYAKAASRD